MKLDIGTKVCHRMYSNLKNHPVGVIIGFVTDKNIVDSQYIIQWDNSSQWRHCDEDNVILYSEHRDMVIWHVDFQERIRERMTCS